MLGTVAKAAVGLVPIVGGVAQGILSSQQNVEARKAAGEAPAQAFINGVSDTIRPPLSGPNDRSFLSGGVGIALIAGVVLILVVVLARK